MQEQRCVVPSYHSNVFCCSVAPSLGLAPRWMRSLANARTRLLCMKLFSPYCSQETQTAFPTDDVQKEEPGVLQTNFLSFLRMRAESPYLPPMSGIVKYSEDSRVRYK